MAQELDDGEFWLPSDFLTDEDLLTDFKPAHLRTTKGSDEFSQGLGNSFWSNSDLSSPVESVNGSTETESDEDEFLTGLTRKMAHSTLQESSLYSDYAAKAWKLSGSPQSTLCGCKQGSSRGSPDSVSRVSSPPPPLVHDSCWDLLCAAAGEVSRMRLIEEAAAYHSAKRFPPPPKPTPIGMASNRQNSTSGFYPNQSQTQAQLAYLQLQASQFQRMKEQQQMMSSGGWGQRKIDCQTVVGPPRSQNLSMAAWPTLQQSQQQQMQQSGPGMRAVFLGGTTAAKKERTGTGVFLPRRFASNPTGPRKKPGCSTALLPDRVVHALNLNLDSFDAPSHVRSHSNFTPDFEALQLKNHNATMVEQRGYLPQRGMHQEFRLPQEWTY